MYANNSFQGSAMMPVQGQNAPVYGQGNVNGSFGNVQQAPQGSWQNVPQGQNYQIYGQSGAQPQGGYPNQQDRSNSSGNGDRKRFHSFFLHKDSEGNCSGAVEGFIDRIEIRMKKTVNGECLEAKLRLNVILSDYDLQELPEETRNPKGIRFTVTYFGKKAETISRYQYQKGTIVECGFVSMKPNDYDGQDGKRHHEIDCMGDRKLPVRRAKGKQTENVPVKFYEAKPKQTVPQGSFQQPQFQANAPAQIPQQMNSLPMNYGQGNIPQQVNPQTGYGDLFYYGNLAQSGQNNGNRPY